MSYYAKRFFEQASNEGIVTDGLILWLDASNPLSYPGSGTTWYDLSGHSNNGIMVRGVQPLSNAMQFDGVDDFVACRDSTSLQLNKAITINAFVKMVSVNTLGNIVSKNFNTGFRCRVSSDRTPWWYVSGNMLTAPAVNLNEWMCLTFMGDSSGLKIYKNGSLVASNNQAYAPSSVTIHDLNIGCMSSSSELFKGQQNDIAIYNRALTPEEVNQNFNVLRNKYRI